MSGTIPGTPQRRVLDAPVTPERRRPVVDKNTVNPALRNAAEQWEAEFVNHMMQAMRETVQQEEGDLENGATRIYRSMLDEEYAKKAAHRGGIGIADLIIDSMDPARYTRKRPVMKPVQTRPPEPSQPTAQVTESTGGTAHEGEFIRESKGSE